MLVYSLKRILWLIPIIICLSFIIFALMELAPGNIVDGMITENMTQEDIAALRAQFDLDRPMLYRFGKYMLGLFQGDLGRSQITNLPVWYEFMSRFPKTLQLALAALVIGVSLSVPLGIFAAKRAGTIWDNATTVFSIVALSMPGFWLGLLIMYWLAYHVKIFPAGYDGSVRSFVLPAVTTAFVMIGTVTRQTRSSMLEVMRQDYLRTARAKGASERQVTTQHALRNAWIPIVTTIGTILGHTLAGSVVVEAVYSWPGVGRLTVDAVSRRDVPMITGCVILTSIIYVVVLLLVDIVYALIDPRIKAQFLSHKRKRRRVA